MSKKIKTSLFNIIPLYWLVLRTKYKTHGKLEDADSIVGLSFGKRFYEKEGVRVPDPSNYELARYVTNLSEERPELPYFLQHEINEHIPVKHRVELNVLYNKTNRRLYLDTYEVLRQVSIKLNQKKLLRPVIVASAFHAPRVDAVAKKMGFETIVLPGLPRVWDKNSYQFWTRNYIFWILHEALALVLYKLKSYL